MKLTSDNIENFLIYTNPLSWVLCVLMGLYWIVDKFLTISSISDWYFIKFKMNKVDDATLRQLIRMSNNASEKNFFYSLRKIALRHCKIKAERLLNLGS